jgi:hypothetical protein
LSESNPSFDLSRRRIYPTPAFRQAFDGKTQALHEHTTITRSSDLYGDVERLTKQPNVSGLNTFDLLGSSFGHPSQREAQFKRLGQRLEPFTSKNFNNAYIANFVSLNIAPLESDIAMDELGGLLNDEGNRAVNVVNGKAILDPSVLESVIQEYEHISALYNQYNDG